MPADYKFVSWFPWWHLCRTGHGFLGLMHEHDYWWHIDPKLLITGSTRQPTTKAIVGGRGLGSLVLIEKTKSFAINPTNQHATTNQPSVKQATTNGWWRFLRWRRWWTKWWLGCDAPRGAPDNCLINYSELSFPAILFPAWPIGKNGSYHALSIHHQPRPQGRGRSSKKKNQQILRFYSC